MLEASLLDDILNSICMILLDITDFGEGVFFLPLPKLFVLVGLVGRRYILAKTTA